MVDVRGGVAVDQDEVSPQARRDAAALMIIAAVNGVATTWLAAPGLFSPAAEARPLADAIVGGLR
ncbi:hypothetical protein [Nonomuraea sediminis]|uniref:hypothetical protein n=1 Tax=Nonomuraea sediminis TaxID=2835864 RepID=UPI001BDC4998|nr:hypothetical protein [Nonomuraea sediminis]